AVASSRVSKNRRMRIDPDILPAQAEPATRAAAIAEADRFGPSYNRRRRGCPKNVLVLRTVDDNTRFRQRFGDKPSPPAANRAIALVSDSRRGLASAGLFLFLRPFEGNAMPKILIVHGAGMNMRGKVQTEIFGPMTLPEYDERIRGYAAELGL